IGKFYRAGDTIYYPIMASISEKKVLTGFVVRWRRQVVTAKALSQFSQLLGTNATIYLGNRDGSLWTDMISPVAPPPIPTLQHDTHFYDYSRSGNRVIASAAPIPNTQWTILIEFSQGIILETSRRFLTWVITIGAALVIIGSLLAWLMSRNITQPLHKLTAAATSMAAGDYAVSLADVDRRDELGKLSRAFNAMANQVKSAQDNLEKKVEERTQQLNTVIKELEAFSYSVSHDLRAPLRSIGGYAAILKEDYASVMDTEANRLTDKIISNAKKMGQLIDDLISFSKMAGKEIKQQPVDMTALAISCMAEMMQQEPNNKYRVQIHPMPLCQGDESLIRQVWLNLISNAIKYSSKKPSPFIEIGYSKEQELPFYFIRDNGAGFDMLYAHKLFGVFQRLHALHEFEGLGIGLALVKRIINRHNGDIRADAVVGEGAAFYFSLPKTNENGY
ncbi:MAG TPA: ATP-binding protein, partial [Chitinophagaceae bacterium]|nr:ATP-binding protein [Chitinophagaceae bacterium]